MRKVLIQKRFYRCIDEIVSSICHLPGGIVFWQSLSEKGKKGKIVVRKKWCKLVIECVFDEVLVRAMLLSCLSKDGLPREESKELYRWVVKVVYAGDEKKLYEDWLMVVR
jgi:hypothetical protein